MPIIAVLREWWRPTLITTIICTAETAFFYLVSIFTIGGGLAPVVASSLLAWSSRSPTPVVIYFLGLGAAALLAMIFAAETRHRAL